MADMDEFLCVTEDELMKEKNLGTSILNIVGYDMLGESESSDLSDIDLQKIQKYVDNHYESKNLCFLREKTKEMNYDIGAHNSKPEGDIKYSSKNYINKHMSSLGLKFLINKTTERYKRSANMRKHGIARHYTTDVSKIEATYRTSINKCKVLENLNY